jgi:hypothetical protein
MTASAIRSRAGSLTCASAAAASDTCSLIISQYCAGESVTSSTPTSHEPYRDAVECGVTEGQVIGAAHAGLKIGDPLRVRPPRRDVEHLSRQVGQDDVSPRHEPGDGQPRLASARRNVEMLLITGDAQALDHRCADRAQLIHDDRVPLLPARGKPGPRCSLNIPDLIAARHRPSCHQMRPSNRVASS